MNPQKIARITGVLFVITFIASIPPVLFLYGPLLDDPRYVVGGDAADDGASLGALLELILIVANISTAVVLYPVVRRVNEILALGYVTARLVECVFIAVGVLNILSLVTLRQEAAAGARTPTRSSRSASRSSRSNRGPSCSGPASWWASATG
jgi:hypothetical protein